jgi:hypothetical protein
VVHELTAWAHQWGVTDGMVKVAIIDTAPGRLTSLTAEPGRYGGELLFGSISL